jgi:hypothetical protein
VAWRWRYGANLVASEMKGVGTLTCSSKKPQHPRLGQRVTAMKKEDENFSSLQDAATGERNYFGSESACGLRGRPGA